MELFQKNQNETDLFQQKILIGDVGQPEDFHRELVRHDVQGKSSNVYESIAEANNYFPKFKELPEEPKTDNQVQSDSSEGFLKKKPEEKENAVVEDLAKIIKTEIPKVQTFEDNFLKKSLQKNKNETILNQDKLIAENNNDNPITRETETQNIKNDTEPKSKKLNESAIGKKLLNLVGSPKCLNKRGFSHIFKITMSEQ